MSIGMVFLISGLVSLRISSTSPAWASHAVAIVFWLGLLSTCAGLMFEVLGR